MARYKFIIEYHGAPYVGWQSQKNGRGVQDVIADGIKGFCGQEVTVFGAGRTDAGVHAWGQVAHVDLETGAQPDKIRDAVNAHMRPEPVAVVEVEKVAPDFDARFSAIKRHYLYRIINRRAPLTLDRGLAWAVHVPLDAGLMHEGAQHLVGNHDFTTFRAAQCQAKSPVKTLDKIAVSRYGEEIEVTVAARSFLHNQVRSIVGTLKQVGEGKRPPSDVARILKARDRALCGPVVPAEGLYLSCVDYPKEAD